MLLTKICGLSTPETLDAAIKGGATHVGFIFFAKSPRNLTPDRAAQLAARVPGHVKTVGVFVDPDPAWLEGLRASVRLDAIQLHGKETPQFAASLGGEIWKAIPIRTRADLNTAYDFRGAVARVLYDAKTPPGTLPGGMGVRFDWTLLDDFVHPVPWALSGGLDPDNVADAVRATRAPMVDVSSGVESEPGIKDVDKIAAFLRATAKC
jgi:phosphoribosylanthranilate isomerase